MILLRQMLKWKIPHIWSLQKFKLGESDKTEILRKLSDKIKAITKATMELEEVPHGTLSPL